jgi:nucleotide-binding universal stress UspA family protein
MIDLHRILVPTDFSKHSDNALRYAVAFAEKFNAELLLLHVVQDLAWFVPEAVLAAGTMPTTPIEEFAAAARTALDRVVQGLNLPHLSIRPDVIEGVPFDAILRFAKSKDVDLIVMGTHGHTGLAHLLMGSVAEKVVRKAPCPVLTVRHPEHEFVHP